MCWPRSARTPTARSTRSPRTSPAPERSTADLPWSRSPGRALEIPPAEVAAVGTGGEVPARVAAVVAPVSAGAVLVALGVGLLVAAAEQTAVTEAGVEQ